MTKKKKNGRGRGRGMPGKLHGRLPTEAHSAETLMTENISLRQQIEHIVQVDNAEFDKLYTVIGSKQTGHSETPKPPPLILAAAFPSHHLSILFLCLSFAVWTSKGRDEIKSICLQAV